MLNYLSNETSFQIQNRRYLGNKYKLLNFIEEIVNKECKNYKTFCDIFAGTGVVGERFNKKGIKIITNDILYCNYVILKAFLFIKKINYKDLKNKISYLNSLKAKKDNYFSKNFGNKYFSFSNAKKIGEMREEINKIAKNLNEKYILLTSLIYAVDKIANTVGHYDAYKEKKDKRKNLNLLIPNINILNNSQNLVFNINSNDLIKKIETDILYIDPPYNSRQYSDTYHLLENLSRWEKPKVYGKAAKMDRTKLKSKYCLNKAEVAFEDLIENAKTKFIIFSQNNTKKSLDSRSNASISDKCILRVFKNKGKLKIFEKKYKIFAAKKVKKKFHKERIFFCKVE